MEGEEEALHRGELVECLHHYGGVLNAKSTRGASGITKLREPMTRFCGISDGTTKVWLRVAKTNPIGEKYFKVICFLNMIGYEITDLIRVRNTLLREITELIGYGVVPGKAIASKLGYSAPSSVYNILKGYHPPQPEKEILMREFCRTYREKLSMKKEAAIKRNRKAIDLARGRSSAKSSKSDGRTREVVDTTSPAVTPVILIMSGVASFLDEENTGFTDSQVISFTEEEAGIILNLSSKLSALSSRVLNTR